MSRRFWVVALFLSYMVVLTACGSTSPETSMAIPTPTPNAFMQTVEAKASGTVTTPPPVPTPTPTEIARYWPPLSGENKNLFLNIPNLQEGDLSNPYIKGKIVIMDKGDFLGRGENQLWNGEHGGGFDWGVLSSICELEGIIEVCHQQKVGGTEKLIAKDTKELGTIIWVDCKASLSGWYYTNGNEGIKTTCIVTVIDKTRNLVVGRETFGPIDPPKEIWCEQGNTACTGYGKIPFRDIAKYLWDLPRL